jgi:hypothetical protein
MACSYLISFQSARARSTIPAARSIQSAAGTDERHHHERVRIAAGGDERLAWLRRLAGELRRSSMIGHQPSYVRAGRA